jgi:hypothetical protein
MIHPYAGAVGIDPGQARAHQLAHHRPHPRRGDQRVHAGQLAHGLVEATHARAVGRQQEIEAAVEAPHPRARRVEAEIAQHQADHGGGFLAEARDEVGRREAAQQERAVLGVRGARGIGQWRSASQSASTVKRAIGSCTQRPKNSRMAAATRSTVCDGNQRVQRQGDDLAGDALGDAQVAAPASLQEREVLGGQEMDPGGDARGSSDDR